MATDGSRPYGGARTVAVIFKLFAGLILFAGIHLSDIGSQ